MKCFAALIALMVLTSCASVSNIKPGDDLHVAPDEGIAIIGLPADSDLILEAGEVKDGRFYHYQLLTHDLMGRGRARYLVQRIPAGRLYGVVAFLYRGDKNDRVFTSVPYQLSCGQSVWTFKVKGGEVAYFGDFQTEWVAKPRLEYSLNMDSAKSFVATTYGVDPTRVGQGEIVRIPLGIDHSNRTCP